MKVSELVPTKYLKKEDFAEPKLLTIREVTKENVAMSNEDAKVRGVLFFEELEKGMVLNTTNVNRIMHITSTTDTDDWPGHKIVVYCDDNVEFGGKIVGGLRVRMPKKQTPAKGGGAKSFEDMDSDIPFAPIARGISGHVSHS